MLVSTPDFHHRALSPVRRGYAIDVFRRIVMILFILILLYTLLLSRFNVTFNRSCERLNIIICDTTEDRSKIIQY